MPAREPAGYSPLQKTLHWTMAALIVVMVAVGLTMRRIGEGELTNTLYEVHKSIGVTLFLLALIRIGVRWRRGAPPLEPGVPAWQRAAAYASHYTLYTLIVLLPVAGLIGTSSCCPPVKVFWTVPVTLPVPHEEAFYERVFAIHFALAYALVAVALIHVAGAFQHHLIRRDRTLIRMLPGGHGELEERSHTGTRSAA
jgi:cytochrome b561